MQDAAFWHVTTSRPASPCVWHVCLGRSGSSLIEDCTECYLRHTSSFHGTLPPTPPLVYSRLVYSSFHSYFLFVFPFFCRRLCRGSLVRRSSSVYKRNICGAERSPWGGTVCDGYLDHTVWPAHEWTTVLDGAALSHFLCLDMNGKERNQLVVNTASLDAPHSLPHSHPSLFYTTFVCTQTARWVRCNEVQQKWSLQCLHLGLNMGDGADGEVIFYGISFLPWSR